MGISRDAFLNYCVGSSALLGLDAATTGKLSQLLAGVLEMPVVIWLKGSGCSGCTISLVDLIEAFSDTRPDDAGDFLIKKINSDLGETLTSAAGARVLSNPPGAQNDADLILIVEGGIPTAFDGMTCILSTENGTDISMKAAVETLAPIANRIVCIGTCACSGGISGAAPNPTGIQTVTQLTGIATLNIPGCPPHPDWIAGTLANVLCGNTLVLDAFGRPTTFYGSTVHDDCSRKPFHELRHFAENFAEEDRCFASMGCQGLNTHADCAQRFRNNGFYCCMQSNVNCIGCTESDFPRPRLIYRE